MLVKSDRRLRTLRICSGLALAFGLAACATPEPWTQPNYPVAYQERHPIEFTDENKKLEVFPRWAFGLDARQKSDVLAYGQSWRGTTKSKLLISVPALTQPYEGKHPSGSTPSLSPAVKASLADVRKALGSAGVPQRDILVNYYPGTYSEAPLTLSFDAFAAKVANECGLWPEDLATGGDPQTWWNQSYWNFGCATQSNLARQTAEPLDLLRPRQETPSDAVMAVDNIKALREGKSPSTAYSDAMSVDKGVP